jgi:hypothetical protein
MPLKLTRWIGGPRWGWAKRCGLVAVAVPAFACQQYAQLRLGYVPLPRQAVSTVAGIPDTVYASGMAQAQPLTKEGTQAVDPPRSAKAPHRVLFVGDSLICGIGAGKGGAATLCAQVAQDIAAQHGSTCRWWSFGLDGGSAQQIRALAPAIRAEMEADGGDSTASLTVVLVSVMHRR